MNLYYNTNGLAHHRLDEAVDLLADLGYDGVALTPDVAHLDPFRTSSTEVDELRDQLDRRGLGVSIEAGARFVLDPRRKHRPTLLSTEGHERRREFYERLIELAAALGSPLVSLWSGAREPDTPPGDAGFALLAERLKPVVEAAAERDVLLCLEPEPGMLVETVEGYRRLLGHLPGYDLCLTIDVGHLAANETRPWEGHVVAAAERLRNVQLDDAKVGVHDHLMFGEGDLDLAAMARALREIEFDGPCAVELSRHSHDAARTAEAALKTLRDVGF
ncbi:MAG: sugar phosphate isomerase/epimerase family protein [Planctomycetota bacterium JB042]